MKNLLSEFSLISNKVNVRYKFATDFFKKK